MHLANCAPIVVLLVIVSCGSAQVAVADRAQWEDYKTIRQGGSPSSAIEQKAQAGEPPAEHGKMLAKGPVVSVPKEPTESGNWWEFFRGTLNTADRKRFGPYGRDFEWAYARKKALPDNPRVVVSMHGSGAGQGAMGVFAPSDMGDIEVRTQDAETYNQNWREWWTFGANGQNYPGRRIGATLGYLWRTGQIDVDNRGIVLEGPSMGGAGAVAQTMTLPEPWRRAIAYSSARAGVIMPRRINQKHPGQYPNFPQDNAANQTLWDSIDFSVQAATDPIVRGIHYRHSFSTNDQFSDGPDGNTQLEFVNLVEKHKIGGAFGWVQVGHDTWEKGVRIPDLSKFELPEQDVSLDRAHPAITDSTGNYPRKAKQRINEKRFPRGHYNMGITWDHSGIVDEADQIVFPLKYRQRTNIGKGVPDQPKRITVSVTPRRPRNFDIRDGEVLHWAFDGGILKGQATVDGDTVTIKNIPLVSGEGYKNLRIYKQ
ncbi:MAG: hypothetical protein AAGA91_00160 [Pseudomonadota bacterium]